MTVMNFPEWKPDLSDLSDATNIALNVIPRTANSYGPFNSLMPYSSNALDGPCIGAVTAQAADSTINIFAGTTDKLYQMVAASTAWADVSAPGGYTTASGDTWHFELYANMVFATNFGDVIQLYEMGTSTVFGPLMTAPAWVVNHNYATVGAYVIANGNRYVLTTAGTSASSGTGPSGTGLHIADGSAFWDYQSGQPPQARYLCTPKNFLLVANTFDPVGGLGPNRVWWSASGDPTTWPLPGSSVAQELQSDFNDFEGAFGEITGVVDSLAGADVAIFFEQAVWRGVYVGPPDIFDFFPAENVRGCRCPNAIVPLGALVFYPGVDGFYAFDGSTSTPIGSDKFDQWFWSTVNQGFLWNVIGATDVAARAIIWIFPSTASSSGIPDTVLIYRWDLQRASYAQFSCEWLMRVLSFGVTLDSFSSLGFTDLDTIPYSLDSRVWIGGAIQLGAIDPDNKLAYFSGPSLAAKIATNTVQATPEGLSWVSGARPLIQLVTGTPTIAISGRNNLYDPITYGTPVPPNSMGECPQRDDHRYQSGLLAMPAGSAWSHAVGIDAAVQPSGWR